MSSDNGYTPTQKRILKLLSDGLPHTRQEIHACLWDEMGALSNIKMHLTRLRKRLNPRGQDIVCRLVNRQIRYQHVRLL